MSKKIKKENQAIATEKNKKATMKPAVKKETTLKISSIIK